MGQWCQRVVCRQGGRQHCCSHNCLCSQGGLLPRLQHPHHQYPPGACRQRGALMSSAHHDTCSSSSSSTRGGSTMMRVTFMVTGACHMRTPTLGTISTTWGLDSV